MKSSHLNKPLAVIVPCFNEEARLPISEIDSFLRQHSNCSIVFVNDASQDGTLNVLHNLKANLSNQVQILSLSKNVGKASAIHQGAALALQNLPDESLIGYLDADGATSLELFYELALFLNDRPSCWAIFGTRIQIMGHKIRRSSLRHYVSRSFATMAALILKIHIYDTQCGAKVFRSAIFKEIVKEPFRLGWIFDLEIIVRMQKLFIDRTHSLEHFDQVLNEYPLPYWTDKKGSKVKWWHALKAAIDLMRLYRYRKGLIL